MIDLHCHILPGVDDGASDMEESVAMARFAAAQGITAIVATPHALGGAFANPPVKIRKQVAALQRHLNFLKIPLTLHPGCEVHFCIGLARRIMAGEATFLCENRRYILVEFPFQAVPDGFLKEIHELAVNGITPVIAHPERNTTLCHDFGILQRLFAMGCIFQVNSTSITGGFGDAVMAFSHTLLETRTAHIIASDAHSRDHRPPDLARAVHIARSILGSKGEAMAMVRERPRNILAGEPLDLTEDKFPTRSR